MCIVAGSETGGVHDCMPFMAGHEVGGAGTSACNSESDGIWLQATACR